MKIKGILLHFKERETEAHKRLKIKITIKLQNEKEIIFKSKRDNSLISKTMVMIRIMITRKIMMRIKFR